MANRPGKRHREFELQGQWITKEVKNEKPYYFRRWYDPATRTAKRKSLGTSDLKVAKERFVDIVLGRSASNPILKDPLLKSVFDHYERQRIPEIRSKHAALRAMDLLLSFMGDAGKPEPRISDFALPWQLAFIEWVREHYSLSAKTISTYMSTVKAAINFAAKPYVARSQSGELIEARILERAPFVETSEAVIAKRLKLTRSKPRDFVPSVGEMAAFIDGIQEEHVFRYVMIALNTWARPEAICQLNVARQVDFRSSLVYLNEEGRPQNSKVRPTIRLTECLRGWLTFWNLDYPIQWLCHVVEN